MNIMKSVNYNPAKRNVSIGTHEGRRFKKLGDFGELLTAGILTENGFENVRNFNVTKCLCPQIC
jgi:hypothetical protein